MYQFVPSRYLAAAYYKLLQNNTAHQCHLTCYSGVKKQQCDKYKNQRLLAVLRKPQSD